VSSNRPDDQIETNSFPVVKAVRYLLRNALRDFTDALAIGRKRRDNRISSEEFAKVMALRFPPAS